MYVEFWLNYRQEKLTPMIQELYQKAMHFAGEKHRDQKVPGTNANYLLHVSNVAMEVLVAYSYTKDFDIHYAIQMAILHDVLEDTDTTYKEVRAHFGEAVAKGVLALTKDSAFDSKKEKMADSLKRINQLEKEVGMVKLADRITNLQQPPKHWDGDKKAYYLEEAKLIADALTDKNEYLHSRLLSKIEGYRKFL